ncbi:MAG: hypothetical protein A2119_01220 [Candidatus Colwellbacteria bacterium GWA2_46_10]|uniref:PEP-utilising enzyme mobile domain-containing protein n=1 Tax=Candidatus Colwellbacteria bacterium GWA2_46_10 TaxID=1797684 RepID=A0A1G1Z007_9BACT|nr:MAG: PEP-utilizing protein mobile region [Microgenomates group bacterium GW2011_GWA1_Microgenomates_45_10]KKU19055.1 MAG: PEP-utilizing protein mobile region [Parcubacteria group bacterium GW2011_GWA2_46_10]OGY56987.1 MAG: hypothetical protein A2119_01220 [Candidatus Colwellbacteria bacterium GWA2_46_10]
MKKQNKEVLVSGQSGSPGIVEGKVIVVRNIGEFGKMEEGAVLVTRITSPPWLPVIMKASAVITDTGGILSHPAIVCREFGIPAVVGTIESTHKLSDGMKVIVDGYQGVVYKS